MDNFAKAFIEAIFPVKCMGCGIFFHPAEYKRAALIDADLTVVKPFVCSKCIEGFLPVRSPMCVRCGEVFQTSEGEDHLCENCIKTSRAFHLARSFGTYDQTLMTLIHRFKYGGKIQLAKPLAMLLLSAFIRFWENIRIDVIVPVPLHVKRFRKRGFNQAYLLVKDWERIVPIGITVPPVVKDVLLRNRWTAPQTGLGRKERTTNIKNAFSVINKSVIVDNKILLVDDVYTTGATAEACTDILLRAGARQVDVLTLARA